MDTIDAAGIAALAKNSTDKYRLFNVWSTTCAPCVKEFPGLVRVARRMGLRKFEMITISMDLPEDRERALKFLEEHRAALPARLKTSLAAEGRQSNNYLYSEPSIERLIQALDPKWEGPLPHTALIAPGGEIVYRHTGQIDENDLLDAILDAMSRTYLP
jgi:thiol-disulfide isomerase/thioredoxin